MPRSSQPEIAVCLASYRLAMPDFAPVFHWLHQFAGLTNEQIAAAFEIGPGRVRSIRSRTAGTEPVAEVSGFDRNALLYLPPTLAIPSKELRAELGISIEPDFVVLSKARRAELLAFEEQVEREFDDYAREGRFEDGVSRMRRLVRHVGQPHSAHLIRILARLRHHSAWFLVHMGRTLSAHRPRTTCSGTLRRLHFMSPTPKWICRAWRRPVWFFPMPTCSVELHVMLSRPLHSHATIQETLHGPLGAEFHRQTGTAQLLLLEDDAAEGSFRKATLAIGQSGASVATQLLWGSRQMNLLKAPNWEKAQDVFTQSTQGVATAELAYQMSTHWALVTALATGDERNADDAFKLLGSSPHPYFGHQATIRFLLELTPRLQLSGETLTRWLRYLMYTNVFRDR